MKQLDEGGTQPVFPKFLKCLNCGCEVLVESYRDMELNLPGFSHLAPPNPPGIFQFGCPNNCGANYVSACNDCRQKFHYEQSISFGGDDDPTHVRFGERKMVEVQDPSPRAAAPKRYRFTHKRRPKRRKGDSDGTVQAP
jgi:hypothetical protein